MSWPNIGRLKRWRDPHKAERAALVEEAAQIARDVMRTAHEDGVQTPTFYCENDGWRAVASSEAMLRHELQQHYGSSSHEMSAMPESRGVISLGLERLKLLRDPYRAEREALAEAAVQIARDLVEEARAEDGGRVMFQCENDGWTTAVTTETVLRQQLQQHYRSSRHKV